MLRVPVRTGFGGPFSLLFDAQPGLERFAAPRWETTNMGGNAWTPAMDVLEATDEIRCYVELPGVLPEEVQITTEGNLLTVQGEKHAGREHEGQNGYRVFERRYGRFERQFRLPPTVDPSRITAHFEHGVLTLVLPKTEAARARRIPIEVGNGKRLENGR